MMISSNRKLHLAWWVSVSGSYLAHLFDMERDRQLAAYPTVEVGRSSLTHRLLRSFH